MMYVCGWRSHGRLHVRGCNAMHPERMARLVEAVAARRPMEHCSLWLFSNGAGYWLTARIGDHDAVKVWGDCQSSALYDMELLLGIQVST